MTTADYEGMTVAQLQALCNERGLATSGTKAELIGRLEADDQLDALDDADEAAAEPGGIGNGTLVAQRDADGNAVRYGIVVDQGREPDEAKGESPEPLVLWLSGTPAAYGGELSEVS